MSEAAALGVELERLIVALARERGRLGDGEVGAGLAPTQRLGLLLVVDEGPLRPNALAELMSTTDATATRTLQSLEALGLVARQPDPSDGRCVQVQATEAGRRTVAAGRKRIESLLARRLGGLSEPDRRRLVELLRELSAAAVGYSRS